MSQGTEDTINIAFISDDGYALPLGVAISSLKRRRDKSRKYSIMIISDGITGEHLDVMLGMKCKNFDIRYVDARRFASYKGIERPRDASHVSTAALYKFNLPDIAASEDKLLYLDCDIIIKGSLADIYDTDISAGYAAVVKDIGAEVFPSHYNERLGISHSAYFNSGVMLLNLKRLRDDGIPSKLLEYRLKEKNHYMDQDAFNVIFRERVKYLPFYCNMALSCWRDRDANELCKYYSLPAASSERLFLDAEILHLSAKEKPWKSCNVIASEIWLYEFMLSPMRKFELHRERSAGGLSKLTNGCNYDAIRLEARYESSAPPKVSVITPVYNAFEHLPMCIESLMCQTETDAEFIMVDDGSSDGSLDVLLRYASIDSRIKVYTQENSYAGIARNNGISHAVGKYTTFLDGDDMLLPSALSDFLMRAEECGCDIVVSSAYHFKDDPMRRETAEWCLRKGFIRSESGINRKTNGKYLFQITAGAPWGKLYRTDFIKENKIKFPGAPRAEDTYFVYLSLALAKSISILERETVLYRNNTESGSLENAKDKYPTVQMRVKEMLYEKLSDIGIFDDVRQSFINNVINTLAYHFRTFKTCEAFTALYNELKHNTVPLYGIDMEKPDYFYTKGEYDYIYKIWASKNPMEYFYTIAAVYKAQADRHWRALMRIQRDGAPENSRNKKAQSNIPILPDYESFLFYTGEVLAIRSSWSYKIGRFITYVPRKIRSFYRYTRKHGFLNAIIESAKRFGIKDRKNDKFNCK